MLLRHRRKLRRAHNAHVEGWHNGSKSCAKSRCPCATRVHGIECVSCDQLSKTYGGNCGSYPGKLRDPGEHLRRSERFDRYGNRPARILANRERLVLAALYRRKEQDRNRFCRPACTVSESDGARKVTRVPARVLG